MRMILAIAMLAGCHTVDDPTQCQAEAAGLCARIGYPDEFCAITMAAHCSAQDAEIARQICVELRDLPADAECVLEWR